MNAESQIVIDFDARRADRTYPDKHEESPGQRKRWLIAVAKSIRDEIADRDGEVSSPEVHREMLRRYPDATQNVEWRFLGVLFRRHEWTKTGKTVPGSHGYPAPVWERRR